MAHCEGLQGGERRAWQRVLSMRSTCDPPPTPLSLGSALELPKRPAPTSNRNGRAANRGSGEWRGCCEYALNLCFQRNTQAGQRPSADDFSSRAPSWFERGIPVSNKDPAGLESKDPAPFIAFIILIICRSEMPCSTSQPWEPSGTIPSKSSLELT